MGLSGLKQKIFPVKQNKNWNYQISHSQPSQGRLYFFLIVSVLLWQCFSWKLQLKRGWCRVVQGCLFCLGKISTFNNPPGPPLPCNRHSHCLVFNLPHRLLQQLTGRSKIFGINFPIFHSILTVIDATVWEIAVHISACFLLRRKWGKLGRGGERWGN